MEELLEVAVLGELRDEDWEDGILFNILNVGGPILRNRGEIYGRFNLNDIAEEDVLLNFRCAKGDILRLKNSLGLQDVIRTPNGHKSTGTS